MTKSLKLGRNGFLEKDLSFRDYRTLDTGARCKKIISLAKEGGGLCDLRSRRGWPAKQKWDMF